MSGKKQKYNQGQCNEIKYDPDINPVLEQATDSELEPLVRYLIKAGTDDWMENSLYEQFAPRHSRYAHLIADAILRKPVAPDIPKFEPIPFLLSADDDGPYSKQTSVKIPDFKATPNTYQNIVKMVAGEIELLYRGWNPECGVMIGHADGSVEHQCQWWKNECRIEDYYENNRFYPQCGWWEEKYCKNTYSVEQMELLILIRILQKIMAEKSDSERESFPYDLNIFQNDFNEINYDMCAEAIQAAIKENVLRYVDINKSISKIYNKYNQYISLFLHSYSDCYLDGDNEYIFAISKLTTPCVAHIAIIRQKLAVSSSRRKKKPEKTK